MSQRQTIVKLRCPRCNGRRTRMMRMPATHTPHCLKWCYVQCPICFCTGPSAPTADDAIEAWDDDGWRRNIARAVR
jgi:hypothetical protein